MNSILTDLPQIDVYLQKVLYIEGDVDAFSKTNTISSNSFFISFSFGGTEGSGWDSDWIGGISFLYDDSKQESLITQLINDDDGGDLIVTSSEFPGAAESPDIILYVDWNTTNSASTEGAWNKRITGARLYLKKDDNTVKTDWIPQIEYDFVNGTAYSYETGIKHFGSYDIANDLYTFTIDESSAKSPNLVGSYKSETGYNDDESSIVSKYKTAVTSNRMSYVGGLEVQYEDGTTEVRGDTLTKTPVNKFDIHLVERRIDASIRDGDEIVKLEEYADRILQFKKKKMHLINVSQDLEFLEDTFIHKGISHPSSACKTDFGIAWANKHGCYLYDGQKVSNLFEKGGLQIIKEDDWESFIGTPMLQYIPLKRQLVVVDDIGSSKDGDCLLYDMVTSSWTKGKSKFTDGNKTNLITDQDGDMVHMHSDGDFVKWSDTSASTTQVSIKTKDIDFGQPSQRKKVYRVRISYKGDADTLTTKFSVNGDSDTFYQFINPDSGSGDDTPLADKTDLTVWHHAELKPTTSSQANNIYSFQLHMSGTADADFEINDISIIYRLKGIK